MQELPLADLKAKITMELSLSDEQQPLGKVDFP
jgi:hypothetical protein